MLKSIAAATACLLLSVSSAHAIKGSIGAQDARSACIQAGGSWDAGRQTCTPPRRPLPPCHVDGYSCGSAGTG
jgi:hypothetical protein